MKKIITFCCCLLFSLNGFSVETKKSQKKVDNKISKVTVFLSGAQVYRKGDFYINPGVTKLMFEGVSPYIDKNSIQARGNGEYSIMDVIFETHYPSPTQVAQPQKQVMPDKVKRQLRYLNDSIADYKFKLDEIKSRKEVYTMERNMLLNNGTVKGTGKVNDSIPLLKDAMEFFREKMTEINMELFQLKKKESKYNTDLSKMNSRLSVLNNWKSYNQVVHTPAPGPIYRIIVTVNAERATKGRLEVGYLVSQAGWKPSYDLRAKNTYSPVELNYKGEVFQNTGNDWNKVPLTLSTANPYANHTKPELSPLYVSYYTPGRTQAYNKVQDAKIDAYAKKYLETVEEEEVASITYSGASVAGGVSNYQYQLNQQAKDASTFTVVTENMISAEYKINLPYSIASNNEKHIVAVTKKSLKAEYNLALVPKLDKNAFLVANVVDWDDLNLVPAQARIYYDGTYIGKSYINPTGMEDTLKLAMGRDNSVSAVRKKLKDKSKDKTIGDNRVTETHYEITIKNTHSYSLNLIVEDQVPISKTEDIKVEVIELDKGDKNEYSGIVKWRFKLKGGGTEKLKLAYSVKYDKNKALSSNF